jgi:hypothetical protein
MRRLVVLVPLLFASLAHAQDAPAFDPNAAPPAIDDLKKLLLAPKSISHVRGYAVDETCITDATLSHEGAPAGLGKEGITIGDVETSHLTLSGPSPAPFADFKKFGDAVVPKGKKMVYGLDMMAGKNYGYRALCVGAEPAVRGADVARVTNKLDPTIDQQYYRIAIMPVGLDKLRTLPKTVHRIAFVYDEVLVLGVANVDDELRAQTEMAVYNAVEFPTKAAKPAKKKKKK